MQQGMPTRLTTISKELRIKQLKDQIKILEAQLETSKRDLKILEKSQR